MLKHRLLFGMVMICVFVGLVLLDGWMDGSLTAAEPKPIQGTLFSILIVLLVVPAQMELSRLIKQTGAVVFTSITVPATVLTATAFYLQAFAQRPETFLSLYFGLVLTFSLLGLFGVQAVRLGTTGTIANCAAGIFSIVYLGLFCAFILGIRVLFGPLVLLLFVFTVKASDIGAYTLGRLFGRHKLAPRVSPGKTWEGLGGAALFGALVSVGFSMGFGIMSGVWAFAFGAVFGVLGQLGDLVESMLKRDASVKDSSASIPGFGGLLDVIDSPLATAPAAFAVFYVLLQ